VHTSGFGGNFRAAQNVTNLRTVPMTDCHVPTLLDHVGNVQGGFLCGFILTFNGDMFIVFDQRVAANGDYSESVCHLVS